MRMIRVLKIWSYLRERQRMNIYHSKRWLKNNMGARGSNVTPTVAALIFYRNIQGAFEKHGSESKCSRRDVE